MKTNSLAHGGSLKHFKRKRPLSTQYSMHFVLRAKEARYAWSLKKYDRDIDDILKKFSIKYQIEIKSYANVGNHLHLHLQLSQKTTYAPFIRAISAAIMMKVTGFCRWRPKPERFQFWDNRPFSRVVTTYRYFVNVVRYIQLNILEGMGLSRQEAQKIIYYSSS